ncbi:hypothetical protein FTX61_09030 [Nitriliruptoraceae bacterium ZYF776]|nr:hypothetical protein [Profundirhabdus halotolerans]
MSPVQVNLLPEATRARGRADRQKAVLAGSGLLLVAALGASYWWISGEVDAAETQLASEEARTAELRGDVNALADIQQLQARQQQSESLLTEVLGGEVSFAGLLQDVASVVPPDTQLETVTVTLDPEATPSDPREGTTIGSFSVTGRTLAAHAPGVERFLLEFDKVASFKDLYLNASELEDPEEPVATFSLDGRLGWEALTGRYIAGTPEVLR